MGKLISIIIGLAAMSGGIFLLVSIWWRQFKILVAGCIPLVLIFGGLVFFIAGLSSLRNSLAEGRDSLEKNMAGGTPDAEEEEDEEDLTEEEDDEEEEPEAEEDDQEDFDDEEDDDDDDEEKKSSNQ